MSEQQRAAGQAAEEDLHDELAKREAVIIQIQEELRQKDMLLQRISMAAAPDAPVIPSPAKRNAATPLRSSRVPRPTPPRFADGPPKGRSPVADMVRHHLTFMHCRPAMFVTHQQKVFSLYSVSNKGMSSIGGFQSDDEGSHNNDADDEGLQRLTRRQQLHDSLHPSTVPKLSPAKTSHKRPSPTGPQFVQPRYGRINCPNSMRTQNA